MSLKHNKQLMCEKPVPAGSQGALSEDEFLVADIQIDLIG